MSKKPELIINSGSRVLVKLPDFIGYAGLVEGPRGIELAYKPNRKGSIEPGTAVVVDEETLIVKAVRASDIVKSMRVLTLARIEEGK